MSQSKQICWHIELCYVQEFYAERTDAVKKTSTELSESLHRRNSIRLTEHIKTSRNNSERVKSTQVRCNRNKWTQKKTDTSAHRNKMPKNCQSFKSQPMRRVIQRYGMLYKSSRSCVRKICSIAVRASRRGGMWAWATSASKVKAQAPNSLRRKDTRHKSVNSLHLFESSIQCTGVRSKGLVSSGAKQQ